MQSLTPKRKVLKPIQSRHSLNHNHDKSHILWSRYLFQLRISMVSQKDRIEIGIARPALLCRVLRKLMNFWLLRQDFSVHIFLRLLYPIVFPYGWTIGQQVAWVNASQSTASLRTYLLGVATSGPYKSFLKTILLLHHSKFARKFRWDSKWNKFFRTQVYSSVHRGLKHFFTRISRN